MRQEPRSASSVPNRPEVNVRTFRSLVKQTRRRDSSVLTSNLTRASSPAAPLFGLYGRRLPSPSPRGVKAQEAARSLDLCLILKPSHFCNTVSQLRISYNKVPLPRRAPAQCTSHPSTLFRTSPLPSTELRPYRLRPQVQEALHSGSWAQDGRSDHLRLSRAICPYSQAEALVLDISMLYDAFLTIRQVLMIVLS